MTDKKEPATHLILQILWAFVQICYGALFVGLYYLIVVVPEIVMLTIKYVFWQAVHWLYTGEFWKDDTK